jgi:hypothetical protein
VNQRIKITLFFVRIVHKTYRGYRSLFMYKMYLQIFWMNHFTQIFEFLNRYPVIRTIRLSEHTSALIGSVYRVCTRLFKPRRWALQVCMKEYIKMSAQKSSVRFNARIDTSHQGPSHPCKDAGVVADSLTGVHNATVKCLFVVNRSRIHKGF